MKCSITGEKGHFLVEHPCGFRPLNFTTRAAKARGELEDFSRQHCATTFVGVVQGAGSPRKSSKQEVRDAEV